MTTENISPIQHACEMVGNKNAELRQLAMTESQQQLISDLNHSSTVLKLTQTLQGVIDAAVNGGVCAIVVVFDVVVVAAIVFAVVFDMFVVVAVLNAGCRCS